MPCQRLGRWKRSLVAKKSASLLGEFYLENVPAGRYAAQASLPGGGRCSFELVIPDNAEMLVELPDVLCRVVP